MQALAYYLGFPFIYILASLPFRALYAVSDVICLLIRLSGYRREVIRTNLRKSFPEKSEDEIRQLSRAYYSYMCDLMVETFKTMKMTEAEHHERVKIENPEVLQPFFDKKQSIALALGHYGNWEWYGPSVTLNTPYQLVVIYRPLTNPYFERMMTRMRTRFGTEITPTHQTLRTMAANKNRVTALAFVADQAAPANAYWTNFLHQDTSVFTGLEKLASRFNYPVVYLHSKRISRGHYTIRFEVMYHEPSKTSDNEISEAFTRRLEKDIIQEPVIWLWSHKRWKHTRPTV
ncbi:MAG: lysophospholipid acyltransferase family protein [Cyclobacteriaceae bacterium]|nr:lysophospholipid acyltransferase family protein [Cyclobacteriaceae bacterium]